MDELKQNTPNLFLVGAPKAGTTSIYNYIINHPDIFMSPIKETNHFTYNEINDQGLYYNDTKIVKIEDYYSLFSGSQGEKYIGEASVSYLFYNNVSRKIYDLNPKAKIIILLRNPVERGFSHFLMDKRLGYVDISFEEIVYKTSKHELLSLYYQQFVELGYYHNQVERYLNTFGKENVGVYLFDDVVVDGQYVLNKVYDLLEIDRVATSEIIKKHNVNMNPKNKLVSNLYISRDFRSMIRKIFSNKTLLNKIKYLLFTVDQKPELNKEMHKYLINLYLSDIISLEKLIDRDLSHWYKTP